ncbi:MAG: ATP-binding protein, partial [Ignavibacteria bacterium]|nr:ATP-binding protein [Ignavibacteria bacterium]
IYGVIKYDSQLIKDVLASDIYLGDVKKGEVKAFLKNDLGFLDEEKKLLDEIALKIESLIERQEKTVNYEKQQKILSAKNEALIRMTEECYQKREKLNTFIKAISEIIVVIDREFNIIMTNKDEIGDDGKCYNKIFGLDQRCVECPAQVSFDLEKDSSTERFFEEKYIQLDAHPIHSSVGKVERVLEVCRDVTNQKQLESQLIQSYKLASLGKLVAGVAHEINNPNTFILGNLKIINESFDDIFPILDDYFKLHDDLKIARLSYNVFKENISVLVNDMINGANRTKKIVSDLRNFAKKDDGALTDDVDINYIIKNNLTLTRKHIKKFAELEVELNEEIPTFKGSFNKIEQVLLNLAINGSEAIEHDHGVVTISTNYDAKNNEVVLIVSDNGTGMSDATIKNIFDPFFTTKRDKGGTGLGLSITYGIIKEINGKIEVTSKVGVGTTFTIRIPATR